MTEVGASGSQTHGTVLASDFAGRAFHALLLTTKREGQPNIDAVTCIG